VRVGVDGDRMRMGSSVLADRLQLGSAFVDDGDDPRLRGDEEPVPAGVKGQDVRAVANGVRRGNR
jgi:hypothetical protein